MWVESTYPALEGSLNPWTTRDVPFLISDVGYLCLLPFYLGQS